VSKPSTPTGLSASAASSSSITVSWSAATGATGYKIYRSSSSYNTYSSVGDVTTTSFTDTGLSANTTYYYKVSAYISGVESALSSSVSAKTDKPIPTTPPVTPTNLGIYYDNGTTISWDQIPGATGYYVYRSTSASGNYDRIATVSGDSYSSYSDKSILPYPAIDFYYYKVSTYNSLGESPLSAYLTWRLLSEPENLRASLVLSGGDKILNVAWSPVLGANSYMLAYISGGHLLQVGTTSVSRNVNNVNLFVSRSVWVYAVYDPSFNTPYSFTRWYGEGPIAEVRIIE